MVAPIAGAAVALGLVAVRNAARRHQATTSGDGPCPTDPPWPSRLRVLQKADDDMQQWAVSIVHDPATRFGQLIEKEFGGKMITARVEHHPWTTHGADIVPGCFKGVTLYEHPGDGAPVVATGAFGFEQSTALGDCALHPEWFSAEFCKCILAGGGHNCESVASTGFSLGEPIGTGYSTGEHLRWGRGMQSMQVHGGFPGMYGESPVTRDEAFAAAQQLQSMYPNIRTLVAQAPDGFYVRVITQFGGGGGGGLLRPGQSLFGDKGLNRDLQRSESSAWRDMSRLPSNIGRVRVQVDRFVTGDFAVGGFAVGQELDAEPSVDEDEAREAKYALRDMLLDKCKCVRNWIRGVGIGWTDGGCFGQPGFHVKLVVDGDKMSDEARGMVPYKMGRVWVQVDPFGVDGQEIESIADDSAATGRSGDYGVDPLGDGRFRMVPSGDIAGPWGGVDGYGAMDPRLIGLPRLGSAYPESPNYRPEAAVGDLITTPSDVAQYKSGLADVIASYIPRIHVASIDTGTRNAWNWWFSSWRDFYHQAPGWLDASDQMQRAGRFRYELDSWDNILASHPPRAAA